MYLRSVNGSLITENGDLASRVRLNLARMIQVHSVTEYNNGNLRQIGGEEDDGIEGEGHINW